MYNKNLMKYLSLILTFVLTAGQVVEQGINFWPENYLYKNKFPISSEIKYSKYNDNLFNNLKKIKILGRGVQGNALLCENEKTHKKYVLKNTKADNISHSNTIYEKFPEFLACEKLANLNCRYLAKPLAYKQISDNTAKILLEYAENNVNLNSLTLQEKKEVLKQILSARRQLHDIGLIHGDFSINNLAIKKDKNKSVRVRIFDFGRTNIIKDSYNKNDILRFSHPYTDSMTCYYCMLNIIGHDKKLANKLNKSIRENLPKLDSLKNRLGYNDRKKYAYEILKIPLNDFDKFNKIIEKWVDDIKL